MSALPSPDQPLLEAFARCRASFQSGAPYSAVELDVDLIGRAIATTLPGMLAKAWCVLWSVGDGKTEETRRWNDYAERLDYDALEKELADLNWEYHTAFSLIQSLAAQIGRPVP